MKSDRDVVENAQGPNAKTQYGEKLSQLKSVPDRGSMQLTY